MLARQEHSTSPLRVVSQAASTSPEDQPWRPDTVKSGLTPKRPRCLVENDEYEAFTRRILRAYARRVGGGDVEALALMLGLAEEVDTSIAEAVKACAPAATPGLTSAPGSASPAKPPSSAGQHRLDVRQVRDKLDMAAGAGCSLAAPVTSRQESSPGDVRWRPSEHTPRSLGLTIRC
jgi:hypothetical protein